MKRLSKPSDALQLMTEMYYKSTVNHMRIFMYVASHNDEVIETRDLPAALRMTQATLNRSMRSMAERSYIREEGLGLLRMTVSPEDERQRIVELTSKGKELAQKMVEMIYGV